MKNPREQSSYEEFKKSLTEEIKKLKDAARAVNDSQGKFLCVLLLDVLETPYTHEFTTELDAEKNLLSVCKSGFHLLEEHMEISVHVYKIDNLIGSYAHHSFAKNFTVWEQAAIVVCMFLVRYYRSHMLTATIIKTLFDEVKRKIACDDVIFTGNVL